MRGMGVILGELEPLLMEMVEDHELQWGDVLSLVHGYLQVHLPGGQEEYEEDGTNPIFYYGPSDE